MSQAPRQNGEGFIELALVLVLVAIVLVIILVLLKPELTLFLEGVRAFFAGE